MSDLAFVLPTVERLVARHEAGLIDKEELTSYLACALRCSDEDAQRILDKRARAIGATEGRKA